MMGFLFLFLLPLSCSGFLQSSRTKQFVDESGRQVVFHGVNAVFKSAPWYPLFNSSASFNSSLNEKDFSLLESWGFNFVRLGLMWPGLMPFNSTKIDQTYLQEIDEIVGLAAKHGIFVVKKTKFCVFISEQTKKSCWTCTKTCCLPSFVEKEHLISWFRFLD